MHNKNSFFGVLGRGLFAVVFACVVSGASAVEWLGLEPANRLCGRMVSSGYLKGKVVLACVGDFSKPENVELAKRLESTWNAYRSRPFVLVGCHRPIETREQAASALADADVTYPIYAGARLEEGREPVARSETFFFIVDGSGRGRSPTSDEHVALTALVTWLTNAETPPDPRRMREIVQFESENLPGAAWLRLSEYRALEPEEAMEYDAFWQTLDEDRDAKDLARLEKFVRQAKENAPGTRGARPLSRAKIRRVIGYYERYKSSERPAIVQEAKNGVAELTWILATLEANR